MSFLNDNMFHRLLQQQKQMQTYQRQFESLQKYIIQPPELNSATVRSLVSMQKILQNVSLPPTLASSLLGNYAQLARHDIHLLQQTQSWDVHWLQQIQTIIPPFQWQTLHNQATIFDGMALKMAALGQVTIVLPQALMTIWQSTSTALQYLNTYHQTILSEYTLDSVRDNIKLVESLLFPPTLTTASLVNVTYNLIEDHLVKETIGKEIICEDSSSFHPTSSGNFDIKGTVEALLAPVGQRFVDKWNGAWETMIAGQSDHQSQATHSGRELLMQLLAELAPDDQFPSIEKVTRKMRAKYILASRKDNAIDLVDACANTLDNMYDVLCGEAHRRNDHIHRDETIIGYLHILGGLIITLLTFSQRDTDKQK